MDLRDLALLLEVVRAGSVQRTARVLGLSRSTVRRQLANLEAAIGAPLLLRNDSGVALTAAGAVVVEEAPVLLGQSDRMTARALSEQERAGGTVRLIIPTGVRREICLMVLGRLRASHPELRIDERESDDPLGLLHEPFDLMLYIGGPPPLGDWYSRVITRVPFRLFGSRAYLERAGTPANVAELAAHPLAAWQGRDVAPDELPLLTGGTVSATPWFVSRNLENVMAAVRDGLAVGLGPVFMDNEGLTPFLADVVGIERTVRVLSPRSTSDDPRVSAFRRSIDQFLSSLPES